MKRRMTRMAAWLAQGAALSLIGCPAVLPPNLWTDTDKVCLDHWSLAHFGSGSLLGLGLGEESIVPTMAVLSAWEALEPGILPGETPLNQACDLAVGGAGWAAIRR